MGKIRRERTKFHLAAAAAVTDAQSPVTQAPAQADNRSPGKQKDFEFPKNIFQGLDIDVGKLRCSLNDEDTRSVRSLSKSIKSSAQGQMKKVDKRKQRKELFLKKLEWSSMMFNNLTKKSNKPQQLPLDGVKELGDVQPWPKSILKPKERGIQKIRVRKNEMEKNVTMFKEMLKTLSQSSDLFTTVKKTLEKKNL